MYVNICAPIGIRTMHNIINWPKNCILFGIPENGMDAYTLLSMRRGFASN